MNENQVKANEIAMSQGQALVSFAYVLSGNAHDAQDIVQTVLLRLMTSTRVIEEPLAFARRAVVNEFLDRQKSRTRWAARIQTIARAPESRMLAQAPDETIANRDALERAIQDLPGRERAAIVLRYFCDVDDATIAEYLGCAPATVRSLVHRGLPRLRKTLARAEQSK